MGYQNRAFLVKRWKACRLLPASIRCKWNENEMIDLKIHHSSRTFRKVEGIRASDYRLPGLKRQFFKSSNAKAEFSSRSMVKGFFIKLNARTHAQRLPYETFSPIHLKMTKRDKIKAINPVWPESFLNRVILRRTSSLKFSWENICYSSAAIFSEESVAVVTHDWTTTTYFLTLYTIFILEMKLSLLAYHRFARNRV